MRVIAVNWYNEDGSLDCVELCEVDAGNELLTLKTLGCWTRSNKHVMLEYLNDLCKCFDTPIDRRYRDSYQLTADEISLVTEV